MNKILRKIRKTFYLNQIRPGPRFGRLHTRTPAQKAALLALLRSLKVDYPDARIIGHRDLPWVTKKCPCFDCSEYASLNP